MTWVGILFCITQSAMFSGLNLAFFSVSKLRLEIEVFQGNKNAKKVLSMRKDSNFLLTTILWGNVGINCLLTLLSNSVMTGMVAFLFSTIVITFLGEIIPQAYFSRHALKMASLLAPILRIYQYGLYPITKLSAIMLDKWLGKEAIQFYHESDLEELLKLHIKADGTDIDKFEGTGALNFLSIDDLFLLEEGENLDPLSEISIKFENDQPVFPAFDEGTKSEFLRKIERSGKKWIVLVDQLGEPRLVINSNTFLRDALFRKNKFKPLDHTHRPLIVVNCATKIGDVIPEWKVYPEGYSDDVVDEDVILFWSEPMKRIITGSDILGRLLRGIVRVQQPRKVIDQRSED